MVDVRLLRHIRLHGNGLAARRSDVADDFVRASPAGGIVDDDGRAFRSQMPGNGGADPFDAPVTTATLPDNFFAWVYHIDFG